MWLRYHHLEFGGNWKMMKQCTIAFVSISTMGKKCFSVLFRKIWAIHIPHEKNIYVSGRPMWLMVWDVLDAALEGSIAILWKFKMSTSKPCKKTGAVNLGVCSDNRNDDACSETISYEVFWIQIWTFLVTVYLSLIQI